MVHPFTKKQKSSIQGWGLFATKLIKKGGVVWRLNKNEVLLLTGEEVKKLPTNKQKFAYPYKEKYLIDLNNIRYLNHSCDPNAHPIGYKKLIASRDIQGGEEITYDYHSEDNNPNKISAFKCNCGSKNCKKEISL